MDFAVSEELLALQKLVRRFVQDELYPLEREVPEGVELPPEHRDRLVKRAKDLGLWALSAPVEYGGGGISGLGMMLVEEELWKSTVGQGVVGGDPPAPLYAASEDQKEKYLLPIIRGEKRSCFALTEPDGGADPAGNMRTTAVRDGDNFIINGTKIFISGASRADFAMVFALTDKEKRARGGITCFLVDKGTPGFTVAREIDTMGLVRPCELVFEDCVVPASSVLGEVGRGFLVSQETLGAARVGIGARTVGAAERALKMAIDYSKQRVTFGQPIAQRQAVQWMIADSAIEIHATRLMTHHAAWKADQGQDIRQEASMVKVHSSEMVCRVMDRVMQIHGGMGYTKDLLIERMYRQQRLWRIVEGPNEVHRWVLARSLLRD